MTDAVIEKPGKPWVVILVAVLQFISAGTFFLLMGISALAVFFGAAWGLDEYVSQQITNYAPNPNFSYGVTLIFGMAALIFFLLFVYFFILGIGLLKAKKYAWYLQIVMSIVGLLTLPLSFLWNFFTLPLGVVLNIVILVFFFQPKIRNFYKV